MCRIKSWWTPTVRQSWVVSAVLLNKFGYGMVLGSSSAMIVALQAPDSRIKIDTEATSWLVSSLALATLSSFPILAVLMNIFGRKIAYCIKSIPAMIGLLLIGCGSDVTTFIIGKILCGISAGSTAILGAVIVGELTSPSHRGMFINLQTGFLNLGSLFIHILTYYIDWQTATLGCLIPFIASIAIAFTWPESPAWLAEKKKFKESIESFYWLRGKTNESTKEIEEIIKLHQLPKENENECSKECVVNFLKKFKKGNFVKPFIIITFMLVMLECSGRHVFPSYAAVIVKGMMTNNVNSFFCTIIIDLLITVGAFCSSYLIKNMKLRKLLFSTGLLSIVLLSLSCLNYYLVITNVIAKSFGWVPITLLSFYFVVSNLSCSTVPAISVGELFPLEHRAVGAFTSGITSSIFFALALKIAPHLFVAFDVYGALLFLAGGLAISLLVLYFMLPETKNKTLLEIEYFFVNGKFREDDSDVEKLEVENILLKKEQPNLD